VQEQVKVRVVGVLTTGNAAEHPPVGHAVTSGRRQHRGPAPAIRRPTGPTAPGRPRVGSSSPRLPPASRRTPRPGLTGSPGTAHGRRPRTRTRRSAARRPEWPPRAALLRPPAGLAQERSCGDVRGAHPLMTAVRAHEVPDDVAPHPCRNPCRTDPDPCRWLRHAFPVAPARVPADERPARAVTTRFKTALAKGGGTGRAETGT
jgi:hypothetical protein